MTSEQCTFIFSIGVLLGAGFGYALGAFVGRKQ